MDYFQFSVVNLPADKTLLAAHFRLRAELFAGWSAPNYCAGFEADVFDTPVFDPIWSVVADDDANPRAVGRMVPADANGTMIEHTWPEALSEGLPPLDECFEVQRLGASPAYSVPEQMAAALILRIGLERYALEEGRPWLVLMTAEKLWRSTLKHMSAIGPIIDVDGVPSVALKVKIDQAEIDLKVRQLAALQEKLPSRKQVA